jgi:dGTPase
MMQYATPQLAPYAVRAEHSHGRVHTEEPDSLRDAFESDRYRILSSASFRRLQYKTQVFVNDEHDHFRTRLTHTLEVAEVSRRLAVALNANERLAEVIALTHDLGHPPFGHAAEAALRGCMVNAGGFEHNVHTLRTVDYLEHPNPDFRGLNLTYEVREGIIKHVTKYDQPEVDENSEWADLFDSGPSPSIEGQIVAVADRMAYDCHDLEDALGANLIGAKELSDLTLWREASDVILADRSVRNVFAIRRPVLTAILNRLICAAVDETTGRIREFNIDTVDDIRRRTSAIVGFSDAMEELLGELEGFLAQHVYRHYRLVRMDTKARRIVDALFEAYQQDTAMLPPRFAARVDEQGPDRVICDYIAGMTDRYCQDEYLRLFSPHQRV